MKKCLFLFLACFSVNVSASWSTTVQDNLFDGGKTAILGGGNHVGMIAVDCTSANQLIFSYILPYKNPPADGYMTDPIDIAVQIDGKNILKTKGLAGKRNAQAIGIATAERDFIINFLKQLKAAKSKITASVKYSERPVTFTSSVRNSTRSVNQLVAACKIKLN